MKGMSPPGTMALGCRINTAIVEHVKEKVATLCNKCLLHKCDELGHWNNFSHTLSLNLLTSRACISPFSFSLASQAFVHPPLKFRCWPLEGTALHTAADTNNAAVAKVLLEAFSAYEVPQIWCSWDINVCWYKWTMIHVRDVVGIYGYCTKSFFGGQDSKIQWEFDKETCGANPEALLLGDTVPLYLAVSWFHVIRRCLATLRVEDAKDFTVTALTLGPLPPIRHMCCDKMWMWVDLFAKLIRNIALCLCFVEIWNGVQI